MNVQGITRRAVAGLVIAVASAWFAPAVWASIASTLTLDQSAGTQVGSTTNLGMDLKFAPSSGDSPTRSTPSRRQGPAILRVWRFS